MAHVKARQVGEVAVVTPHGYLMGDVETDELRNAIEERLAAGNRKLVVDLMETIHLNSTALGILNMMRDRYEQQGGRMKLCHLNHRIENALVITRLALRFEVYETEREAIESFRAGVAT